MVEFGQAVDHFLFSNRERLPGCHQHIYHKWRDTHTVYYIEEWQSEERFKEHLHSNRFKSLIGAMKVLGEIQMAQVITGGQICKLEKYIKDNQL